MAILKYGHLPEHHKCISALFALAFILQTYPICNKKVLLIIYSDSDLKPLEIFWFQKKLYLHTNSTL